MDPRLSHALYRFWNAAGDLLYVGISVNPYGRFEQHQADKPWWGEVAKITMQPYPDRESVLAAERDAIECEHPAYNVQHNDAVVTPAYERGYKDGLRDARLVLEEHCPAADRWRKILVESGEHYSDCPECGRPDCQWATGAKSRFFMDQHPEVGSL